MQKTRTTFLILGLLWSMCNVFAQTSFVPFALSTNVNSTYDEESPVMSPDGRSIYFTRIKHPLNVNTRGEKVDKAIWVVKRSEAGWTDAVLVPGLNHGKHNRVVAALNGGQDLLLEQDGKIVRANGLADGTYSVTPTTIRNLKNATFSSDGATIIFTKAGKAFVSNLIDGEMSSAEEIGLSGLHVSDPHLTHDGTRFYFKGKVKGEKLVYYVCKRKGSLKEWDAPVKLHDSVNADGAIQSIYTSGNGAWATFSKKQNTTRNDIWLVKLYEDKPYQLVRGNLVNSVSGKNIRRKGTQIVLNGQPAENFFVNADSGTFWVKVPLGMQYKLAAQSPHFKGKEIVGTTEGLSEFSVKQCDLQEDPLPYVQLHGRLLIKNTEKNIPSYANAKIVIDGEIADSARIDRERGYYEVNVKHGTSYYVQVTASRFESLPELVDLSAYDAFEQIEVNLHADAEKMAFVTGKIIDKKTGRIIHPNADVAVRVEGVSNAIVTIDSLTRIYELRLPLKEKHVISANLKGYCPVYETVDITAETKEITFNRDLLLVPFEVGQSVRLNNVIFQTGKVILDPASYPELDRLVAFLNNYPSAKVEIGAHTDRSSKISTLNMAKAVTAYLTEKGVAKNRITSRGYSSTKPVVPHASPDAKVLNKRIEYTITEK